MVKVGVMRTLRSIDLVTWIRADNLRVDCERCHGFQIRCAHRSLLDWIRVDRLTFWTAHAMCREPRKSIDGVGMTATLSIHSSINGVKEAHRQPECTFSFGNGI